MAETATVELLTAEVRVLMVGSRQVTLSVARQLDVVHIGDIRPFGRIRTGMRKPFASIDLIEVIGAADDGALARSSVERERYLCGYGHPGRRLIWSSQEVIALRCPDHRNGGGPEHVWNTQPDAWPEWQAWQALPLIVLAGLK